MRFKLKHSAAQKEPRPLGGKHDRGIKWLTHSSQSYFLILSGLRAHVVGSHAKNMAGLAWVGMVPYSMRPPAARSLQSALVP